MGVYLSTHPSFPAHARRFVQRAASESLLTPHTSFYEYPGSLQRVFERRGKFRVCNVFGGDGDACNARLPAGMVQ